MYFGLFAGIAGESDAGGIVFIFISLSIFYFQILFDVFAVNDSYLLFQLVTMWEDFHA